MQQTLASGNMRFLPLIVTSTFIDVLAFGDDSETLADIVRLYADGEEIDWVQISRSKSN